MKQGIFLGLILVAMIIASGCAEGDDNTNVYIDYFTPIVEQPVPDDLVELVCKTKLVGFKNELTVQDKQALESAKLRCQVHFPEAPCLKKFMKKRHQVYHAICGRYHESED